VDRIIVSPATVPENFQSGKNIAALSHRFAPQVRTSFGWGMSAFKSPTAVLLGEVGQVKRFVIFLVLIAVLIPSLVEANGGMGGMSLKFTTKVHKEGDSYLATMKGVVKNGSPEDFVGVKFDFLCPGCGRCNVCKKDQKWESRSVSWESEKMKPGEQREFELVYAELKADIPKGKTPAAPRVEWSFMGVRIRK
jgi:hypothetical protein